MNARRLTRDQVRAMKLAQRGLVTIMPFKTWLALYPENAATLERLERAKALHSDIVGHLSAAALGNFDWEFGEVASEFTRPATGPKVKAKARVSEEKRATENAQRTLAKVVPFETWIGFHPERAGTTERLAAARAMYDGVIDKLTKMARGEFAWST